MNTEFLRRILDKARDDAATPAEADEIRCLMVDLDLGAPRHAGDINPSRGKPVHFPPFRGFRA